MARKRVAKQQDDCYDEVDSDECDFNDPEDFVDDIKEEELLRDILAQKPKESDVSQSVIILDGLPEVGTEKVEKLKNHLKKILKNNKLEINSDSFPVGSNGKTKGFALLEMKNKAAAEDAVRVMNNHILDKSHTLACYLQTEINKYTNVPARFEPTATPEYQEMGNLHYYLLNENCYDQFLVIHNPRNSENPGMKTSVYLNSVPEPTLLEVRNEWTASWCRWSPKGSYLATLHEMGIALWGREKFQQVQRFLHRGVQFIDFSPCEKYLATYAPKMDVHGEEPKFFLFDVRTGIKKRQFVAESRHLCWPMFKWGFHDEYFSRLSTDTISVYETTTFGLLDKKSIKIPGVKDYHWSPSDNIIAYWVPENNEVPAKVSLMQLPSKEEVRSKNLFNVADCKIHWQKSGDFLCVCVARYQKAKRDKNDVKYTGIYYSLEIFHMRERGVPVDSLEIKETISCFEWEPTDNKFAVISGETPHISVTFYQVLKGQAPEPLKRLEKRQVNSIFWSPRGQFVVLAGLKQMSGALEFIDTQNLQMTTQVEHFMMTDVDWDPTGRYVVTSVSYWERKVDNAYWMWSFQGKCLRKQPMDELCMFTFRPRPPSPLTNADMREIKKKMKKLNSRFELEDQMRSSRASEAILEERRALKSVVDQLFAEAKAKNEEERETRMQLRGGRDTSVQTEEETYEEIIEFLVKKDTVAA